MRQVTYRVRREVIILEVVSTGQQKHQASAESEVLSCKVEQVHKDVLHGVWLRLRNVFDSNVGWNNLHVALSTPRFASSSSNAIWRVAHNSIKHATTRTEVPAPRGSKGERERESIELH